MLSRDYTHWFSGRRLYLLLACAYLVLGILFTYPLIAHFSTQTPAADASGDQFQSIWFFWWMKKALALGVNPYWTNDIYYPYGTGLGYHLSPFTDLVAIGISAICRQPINGPAVYNVIVFLSFVITGLASFLLFRHVSKHPVAAFWGSLFVTVSPYRLWHLNHLNLLSFGWGILAIYFVVRLWETPCRAYAIGAATSLAVLFYASLSDVVFVVFFVLAYVIVTIRRLWGHAEFRRILRLGLAACALAAVLVLPGLVELHSADSAWTIGWRDTVDYASDLPSHFIPIRETSRTAAWFGFTGGFVPGNAGEVFLGWLLVALTVAFLLHSRKHVPRLWFVLAVIFLVLSLGPTLKVGTYRLLPGLLPYRWLYEIVPYLNLSRTPSRFVVLTQLCLVVFVTQGLALWIKRAASAVRGRAAQIGAVAAATIVLVAALQAEYSKGQIELWDMGVPSVYHEVASDQSIRAIYEGPIAGASQLCNRYMYWQTFHGKKVANGYLTHPSRGAGQLLERMQKWTKFGDEERAEMASAGIDAMVYLDPADGTQVIRLR